MARMHRQGIKGLAVASTGLALGAATAALAEPADVIRLRDGHTGAVVELKEAWLEAADSVERGDAGTPNTSPKARKRAQASGDGGVPGTQKTHAKAAGTNPEADNAPDAGTTPTAVRRSERGDAGVQRHPILATERPDDWLRSRHRRCRRGYGVRYCDGPLRVAEPHGKADQRAERLDLGTVRTVARLMHKPARPKWIEAVEGEKADTLRWPVDGGRLSRGFGRVPRNGGRGYRLHEGLDIVAETGTRVLAVNDAIVAYSHYEIRGYGNMVMLIHADGTASLYAHLHEAWVFPGQRVERGEVIGRSGHTGLARGPHLHFEWRDEGRPKDPLPHIVGRPDDDTSKPQARITQHRSNDS